MYDECFIRIGGAFSKLDFILSRPAITSSTSAAEADYTPFYDSFKRMAFYIARTKGKKWFQLITGTF